ncbi:MAG TPA: DoxX family protein [Myxococcota bacterium]|nr:DoxX family protein [Myxococcota bacterium]
MLKRLISTENDPATAIVRVILGLVFFAHGSQKALGWFGGGGFTATMGFFTGMMHIPPPLAFLAICAEFLGGMGLLVGLLARIAALGIAVNMVVAIATVHYQFGFFMNWFGNQRGEGFEYHLLVIGMALLIILRGAGAFSLDHLLASGIHSGSSDELVRHR